MVNSIKQKPIGASVAKNVIFLTLLSTLSIGAFSYLFYRSNAVIEYANTAAKISMSVAEAIEPDKFTVSKGLNTQDDYWHTVKSYLDAVKTKTDLEYLYILTLHDSDNRIFKYYAEGMKPSDNPNDVFDFGYIETNPSVFAGEAVAVIISGIPQTTSVYESEGFGYMVSGFAPIFDSNNNPIGVVGTDIGIDDVLRRADKLGAYVAIASVLFSMTFAFMSKQYIQHLIAITLRGINRDVLQLANKGALSDVANNYAADDDIGALYANFSKVVDTLRMLVGDVQSLYDVHVNGEFEKRIDESKYVGAYLDLARGINSMAAIKRNLSAEDDVFGQRDDRIKIINKLHSLVEAIKLPSSEASDIFKELSFGSLNAGMTGSNNGSFSLVTDNLQETIDELSLYIKELEKILEA